MDLKQLYKSCFIYLQTDETKKKIQFESKTKNNIFIFYFFFLNNFNTLKKHNGTNYSLETKTTHFNCVRATKIHT